MILSVRVNSVTMKTMVFLRHSYLFIKVFAAYSIVASRVSEDIRWDHIV